MAEQCDAPASVSAPRPQSDAQSDVSRDRTYQSSASVVLSHPSPPVDATDSPPSSPAKGSSEASPSSARDEPGLTRRPPQPQSSASSSSSSVNAGGGVGGGGTSSTATSLPVQPPRPPFEREQPPRSSLPPSGAPLSTSMHPVNETRETPSSFNSLGTHSGTLGGLSWRIESDESRREQLLQQLDDMNTAAERSMQLAQAHPASSTAADAATDRQLRPRTESIQGSTDTTNTEVNAIGRRGSYSEAIQGVEEGSLNEKEQTAGASEDDSNDKTWTPALTKNQKKKNRHWKKLQKLGATPSEEQSSASSNKPHPDSNDKISTSANQKSLSSSNQKYNSYPKYLSCTVVFHYKCHSFLIYKYSSN